MKKRPLYLLWALTLTLCALCTMQAQAQSQLAGVERVLRVASLTADMRDELNRELARTGQGRMTYACVPAGIIVIADTQARSEEQVIDVVEGILRQRSHEPQVEAPHWSIQQAEQACANARNR